MLLPKKYMKNVHKFIIFSSILFVHVSNIQSYHYNGVMSWGTLHRGEAVFHFNFKMTGESCNN